MAAKIVALIAFAAGFLAGCRYMVRRYRLAASTALARSADHLADSDKRVERAARDTAAAIEAVGESTQAAEGGKILGGGQAHEK